MPRLLLFLSRKEKRLRGCHVQISSPAVTIANLLVLFCVVDALDSPVYSSIRAIQRPRHAAGQKQVQHWISSFVFPAVVEKMPAKNNKFNK